jgi:hypothetical protein
MAEIFARAEVNLVHAILKIGISAGKARSSGITFLLAEGQKPIKISRPSQIYDRNDAMKKSTFSFWIAEIRAERMHLSNHCSRALVE